MSANYRQELEVALQAVSEAARVCRSVQSKIAPNSMEKADRSPVTIADYASQAIVARLLSQAFPHDPIIGEEDAGELRLWLPLQGENLVKIERPERATLEFDARTADDYGLLVIDLDD